MNLKILNKSLKILSTIFKYDFMNNKKRLHIIYRKQLLRIKFYCNVVLKFLSLKLNRGLSFLRKTHNFHVDIFIHILHILQ